MAPCCHRREGSFFLQLSKLLYVCKVCSIPSSLDGHVGGFRVLTPVSTAAGNGVGVGQISERSCFHRLRMCTQKRHCQITWEF